MVQFTVGILTVSDTCSNGTAIDTSGPKLRSLVNEHFTGASRIEYKIVPDDLVTIENTLLNYCDELKLNLILTNGGTGFSQRDVTPEATRRILQREAPQLALAMSLVSFQKTKFAALSRAVCGIRNESLIINFPGSEKAVVECFDAVRDIIPHAVELIIGKVENVRETHRFVQTAEPVRTVAPNKGKHVCPHKTGTVDDRNSPFPMISVDDALNIILKNIINARGLTKFTSPIDIPSFRASIKDGYAVKSSGGKGVKRVNGYVSAGDSIHRDDFESNSCFKINTGAPVPDFADAIIQVEDTRVLDTKFGVEKEIEILVEPSADLDIRPVGCDLGFGAPLFSSDHFPGIVPYKSMMASVGQNTENFADFQVPHDTVHISIISTGDELTEPSDELKPGKIFDSNTTMLRSLLEHHGFKNISATKAKDSFDELLKTIQSHSMRSQFIICSGSVSMGDKDFLKAVLEKLDFSIHFGRVNMKPGKPMTFATAKGTYCNVFGLPGNPVSAFATFHLFVLPSLRKHCGYPDSKLSLAKITVELLNSSLELDPRPEYARARILSKNGKLFAKVNDSQMSSRLKSIVDADVLLHLPGSTAENKFVRAGALLTASVLKQHFISSYE